MHSNPSSFSSFHHLCSSLFIFLLSHSPHPDLATQMRYLTGSGDVPDSPQLNRNSRVLSWISESEDMLFEDTGTATANSEWVVIARQSRRCFVGFRLGDKRGYFSLATNILSQRETSAFRWYEVCSLPSHFLC